MASSTDPAKARFPPHDEPRVWLLTSGSSPLAVALATQLVRHGDCVALGLPSEESGRDDDRNAALEALLEGGPEEQRSRLMVVDLDIRFGRCQAGIAQTLATWGKIDIVLCCTSRAIVGSIEELSSSVGSRDLMRDQFESTFFGPVNVIKVILPEFRARRSGHLLVLTGINGHIGTPGLGAYCASNWALEGYCDSLAYEVAPFNVKVTIVQPNMEVNVLTNEIIFAPPMAEYAPGSNPAPSIRAILSNTIEALDRGSKAAETRLGLHGEAATGASLAEVADLTQSIGGSVEDDVELPDGPVAVYPSLTASAKADLLSETVYALTAIGGHENPPARHIVGHEGVASVKEKLKAVTEELEDFVRVSVSVDVTEETNVGASGAAPA
ncbi:MAG: hypothetical protein M1832_003072 [Thelocarpon impressellum]|nr:MAG: hypothetical protein M1832_003072 [Thelocarpon impressellum]